MVLFLILVASLMMGSMSSPMSVHLSTFNEEEEEGGGSLRAVVGWVDDSRYAEEKGWVEWGVDPSDLRANVSTSTSGQYDKNGGWNYFAILPLIDAAHRQIYYRVGDGGAHNWSQIFLMKNPAAVTDSFKAWVLADWGIDNAAGPTQAVNQRFQEFDLYVHAGDISYANDHPLQYESWWRKWWAGIQNASSSAPYMAAPGNHEVGCRCLEFRATRNFTVFKRKFLFPGSQWTNPSRGSGDNMWYSFDFGPVHFLSISSESDYPGSPRDLKRSRDHQDYPQIDFIKADLSRVNRTRTPFVIAYFHRPMYVQGDKLERDGKPVGQPAKIQAAFEEIFHNAGVDLMITGHTHMYQRTAAVYQGKRDASGAISIVAGGGGSFEGLTKSSRLPTPSWIEFEYNQTESFGTLTANRTYLHWEAFSAPSDLSRPSVKIDEVYIAARDQ